MAKMLTEEEVEEIEKQRELRDRARAAGSTAGMGWNERKRFAEAQERQMWDQRFRETHGGLSRAEVAAAGPNGSGRQYGAIKRGYELQAAQAHEMDRLGKELATRETEAHERRMGMAEQGMRAAEFNKEAAIRAAELQTASAKEIAGINAASNEKIAGINATSQEKINKDKNDANVEVAGINKEGTVEATKIQAEAQEKRLMAENLMRKGQLDEKSAIAITEAATEMVKNSKNKRTGVPTMTYDEAVKKVLQQRKATGQSVGTQRPLANWGV